MINEKNLIENEKIWNENLNITADPLKNLTDISSESIISNISDDFKTDKKIYDISLENLDQIFDYKKEFNIIDLDEDSEDIIKLLYIKKQTKPDLQNISSLNDNSNKTTKFKSENVKEILEKNLINHNKNIFKSFIPLKRGRRPFNTVKKGNISLTNDNLERKIQVNFITFLVNLANDVIKFILNNKEIITLKQIDYSVKKITEYNYLQELKNYSYFDILAKKLSKKYKKLPEDYNKIKLNQLCNQSIFLRNFFEQNYLKIFKNYYYNNLKPLNQIIFEGVKVNLSTETESFYYLLKKNENNKEVLNYLAKIAYF